MDYIDLLKKEISEKASLPDIVDAFEKMCSEPIADDMILFETGTFSFTGEPLFYFCLVRQFPKEDDDEFYQIHVEILFQPDSQNCEFSGAVWNEDIEENIFHFIRKSNVFAYAKSQPYRNIKIYMDAT